MYRKRDQSVISVMFYFLGTMYEIHRGGVRTSQNIFENITLYYKFEGLGI